MAKYYTEILIEFECLQAIAVYIFLLLMIFSFMKLLLFKDDGEKNLQKIIGGLAVFIVAIISKNGWVFSASLFIGGLIIASEEFMQKLAIILRSKSEDIGQNLKTEPATQLEIDKKQEDENVDSIKCDDEKVDRKKQFQERRAKIKIVEDIALKFLSSEYGTYFKPEIKIETEMGNLIADGILYDSPVSDVISKIVEIKYIESDRVDFMGELHIKRILERIRFLLINLPVLIVLVSENITKEDAVKIAQKIKKFGNVELRVINISNNDIEIVY